MRFWGSKVLLILFACSYEMKMAQQTERLTMTQDDTEYEDATHWNIDTVIEFFSKNGHSDHAHVFKDQVELYLHVSLI